MRQAKSLIATVSDPWESLTQALRDNDTQAFGDPTVPGTPAFHVHHAAIIFRLHARKLIAAIQPGTEDRIPSEEVALPVDGPWSPESVLRELTTQAAALAEWLDAQGPEVIEKTTLSHSNRDQSAAEFLDMMTRHIVWHAAAAYYRARPLPGT